jgi:hypothetical protein
MRLDLLYENSWELVPAIHSGISRRGFWSQNAPAKYRDLRFTDPSIPRDVIIQVARKHPNGLHGARSATQYFINLGSAKRPAMDRLKQIAKWLSDEIKRQK